MPIHLIRGNGLPLRAEKSEKKFKIFLLDVVLLASGLGWENLDAGNKLESSLFRGVIAEQFVAQELHALQDPFVERGLYYWENTDRSSSAEIDFLVNLSQQMLPIEVKAGPTGRLKSLRQFMATKGTDLGVRISEYPLARSKGILSIPFYLISETGRLVNI